DGIRCETFMRQQYMQHGDAMVWLLMSTTIQMVLRMYTTNIRHGLLGLPATNMMMCNMGLGQ
ncbi:hypothetical protein OFN36_30840, partial [Escherichia coli]|nr:hypothetical protein [Escherichia coli]